MKPEDKDLLIRDICARLPYNTYCHIKSDRAEIDDIITPNAIEYFDIWDIKPYLRPMSSMTEEELKEFRSFHCVYDLHPYFHPMMCNMPNLTNMFDWLNAHYFDYRGLIKKGIALEAPEGMYNINE